MSTTNYKNLPTEIFINIKPQNKDHYSSFSVSWSVEQNGIVIDEYPKIKNPQTPGTIYLGSTKFFEIFETLRRDIFHYVDINNIYVYAHREYLTYLEMLAENNNKKTAGNKNHNYCRFDRTRVWDRQSKLNSEQEVNKQRKAKVAS